MLTWIIAGLGVLLANIYLPALLYIRTEGVLTHVGSRDVLPEPGVLAGRARRALANTLENMPIFLTLGLLAMIVDGVDPGMALLGAQLFVLGRIAYTLCYLVSIPWTRSAAYTVGLAGCALMLIALF